MARWCQQCRVYGRQCADCHDKERELEIKLAEARAREAEAKARSERS